MKQYVSLALSLSFPLLAAGIGGAFTVIGMMSWYSTLSLPPFTPPTWVFGPAWSILYLGMGVSSWIVWNYGFERQDVKLALWFYMAQLVLNVLWTAVFFALNSHFWGLIELLALDVVVLITTILFWRISVIAGVIFAVYMAWLSFATAMNVWITTHNP